MQYLTTSVSQSGIVQCAGLDLSQTSQSKSMNDLENQISVWRYFDEL